MNIITIDPSLICTAMVVDNNLYVYAANHIIETKTGKPTKWFNLCDSFINLRGFDLQGNAAHNHTDSEIAKLVKYDMVTDAIISDLKSLQIVFKDAVIGIEGYSYSSVSGPLIDLVTFGTILRYKLLVNGATNINIIPPQELKTKAASLVYSATVKGKVTKYLNHAGVSAGSFKKQDMLQCLYDDTTLSNDDWVSFLNMYKSELSAVSSVPKPIEDINDAKLLYEWFKRNI